ncbi:hypothetical protein [Nonomuraea sp. KM90]|uniref:hypothetical protein n=1 Tax=Nonomuraea sp. KM90 TaxID=3457428 RepID=UPI003FCE43EE
MVMPALALTAASLDASSAEADHLLGSLELFERVEIASLAGADRVPTLAAVMAKTDPDAHDAHVVAIADVAALPILTLDRPKWEKASQAFENPCTSE